MIGEMTVAVTVVSRTGCGRIMPELLTLARMARRVGVTQLWLRKRAKAGEIPCLKADCRYLFNAEAVQESLAAMAGQNVAGSQTTKEDNDDKRE
jgi:hypothetical protein